MLTDIIKAYGTHKVTTLEELAVLRTFLEQFRYTIFNRAGCHTAILLRLGHILRIVQELFNLGEVEFRVCKSVDAVLGVDDRLVFSEVEVGQLLPVLNHRAHKAVVDAYKAVCNHSLSVSLRVYEAQRTSGLKVILSDDIVDGCDTAFYHIEVIHNALRYHLIEYRIQSSALFADEREVEVKRIVTVSFDNREYRLTRYGVGADFSLRPLSEESVLLCVVLANLVHCFHLGEHIISFGCGDCTFLDSLGKVVLKLFSAALVIGADGELCVSVVVSKHYSITCIVLHLGEVTPHRIYKCVVPHPLKLVRVSAEFIQKGGGLGVCGFDTFKCFAQFAAEFTQPIADSFEQSRILFRKGLYCLAVSEHHLAGIGYDLIGCFLYGESTGVCLVCNEGIEGLALSEQALVLNEGLGNKCFEFCVLSRRVLLNVVGQLVRCCAQDRRLISNELLCCVYVEINGVVFEHTVALGIPALLVCFGLVEHEVYAGNLGYLLDNLNGCLLLLRESVGVNRRESLGLTTLGVGFTVKADIALGLNLCLALFGVGLCLNTHLICNHTLRRRQVLYGLLCHCLIDINTTLAELIRSVKLCVEEVGLDALSIGECLHNLVGIFAIFPCIVHYRHCLPLCGLFCLLCLRLLNSLCGGGRNTLEPIALCCAHF